MRREEEKIVKKERREMLRSERVKVRGGIRRRDERREVERREKESHRYEWDRRDKKEKQEM